MLQSSSDPDLQNSVSNAESLKYPGFKEVVPFQGSSTLETSKFYMGSIMSFLAKGEDTEGRVACMQYQAKPGNEPPPHSHDFENEMCYIQEGVVEFYFEDRIVTAGPGEFVFAPQGKPHAFYIRTPNVKFLIIIQATSDHPVGLDSYFLEMASPADSMSLPKDAITYQMENPEHAIRVGAEHGIRILSPEETLKALPLYPGFGVPRELVG